MAPALRYNPQPQQRRSAPHMRQRPRPPRTPLAESPLLLFHRLRQRFAQAL